MQEGVVVQEVVVLVSISSVAIARAAEVEQLRFCRATEASDASKIQSGEESAILTSMAIAQTVKPPTLVEIVKGDEFPIIQLAVSVFVYHVERTQFHLCRLAGISNVLPVFLQAYSPIAI